MNDKKFLQFIHARLIEKHGEDKNTDYMHKLRAIIAAYPEDKETRNTCSNYVPEDAEYVYQGVYYKLGDTYILYYKNGWRTSANVYNDDLVAVAKKINKPVNKSTNWRK
jgi:hypothetical protein